MWVMAMTLMFNYVASSVYNYLLIRAFPQIHAFNMEHFQIKFPLKTKGCQVVVSVLLFL